MKVNSADPSLSIDAVKMDSVLLRFPIASSVTTGSCTTRASWYTRKIQKENNFLKFSRPNLNHRYKGIKGMSTCQEWNRKYVAKVASKQYSEHEHQAFDKKYMFDSVTNSLDVFYKFSRPHGLIPTVLRTISACVLAVEKLSEISPQFFTGLLQAEVATLLIYIFIVGLNQLCDVEIDKINKPHLPLASGEYSFGTGFIITYSSLILSFVLSLILGSWPLFWTLFAHFIIASAYSINVPLLRWKNSPITATLCISVQEIISIFGYFLHMQTYVLKKPIIFPRPLIFANIFMGFFFILVAQLKDLTDIEGDRKFGVKSLPVLLGSKPVFWTCVSLLEIAYGVSLFVGISSPHLWSKFITGLGHAILALILWYRAKSVDLESNASAGSFYKFFWKLATAEYFVISFFR